MDPNSLKPRSSARLIDLVKAAGFDVSDWGNYEKGPDYASQNPRYCYEWSFVDRGKQVLLSLWHQNLRTEDGAVVHRRNFREDARAMRRNPNWVRRATNMDLALQHAARKRLPIRVIINEGLMRDNSDEATPASQVRRRMLDTESWVISSYELMSGNHIIRRGT